MRGEAVAVMEAVHSETLRADEGGSRLILHVHGTEEGEIAIEGELDFTLSEMVARALRTAATEIRR